MGTILVVDDDPDTCDLLSRYLARDGHEVVCAANGWEGLLAADRHRVDLIVLDVTMPGMDGETFLGIVRRGGGGRTDRDVPVVAVTALDRAAVAAALGRLGVSAILTKGVDELSDLADVVGDCLRGAGLPGLAVADAASPGGRPDLQHGFPAPR